ncbi:MAG: PIN domain-containing protein [Planctomycetota bacterium]
MPRIRKQKPPPHIVFVDTSTLWHDDKQFVVDPKVDAFWEKYSQSFALELSIPEVVRGELLFQQSTSAQNNLRKANDAIKEISKITTKNYSHRISESRIKTEVEKKFDRWVSKCKAKILYTPTNTIDWKNLINKSIWRKPPFPFDKKNIDGEKGFRDALILETIIHHYLQKKGNVHFAFLCKDKLLRETAESTLSQDHCFNVYEFIDDFKTYLDLTKGNLEDYFIKALVKRASEKFFMADDSGCLYYRENIQNVLQDKYKKFFDNPRISLLPSMLSPGLREWTPIENGRFVKHRAQFVKSEGTRKYIWLSVVTFVQQFQRSSLVPSALDSTEMQERLLLLPFHITWSSNVTNDGRFRDYNLLNHELKNNEFRMPTDEDRKNWDLKILKS